MAFETEARQGKTASSGACVPAKLPPTPLAIFKEPNMEKPLRYPQWTEQKTDLLETLWRAGVETKEIRKRLGGEFSRAAIQGKVLRLKLPRRGTATVTRPPSKAVAQSLERTPLAPEKPANHSKQPVRRFSFQDGSADIPNLGPGCHHDRHTCKWPLGDPAHPDVAYCGKATDEGAYCASHKRLAFSRKPQLDVNSLYKQIIEIERSGRRHAA